MGLKTLKGIQESGGLLGALKLDLRSYEKDGIPMAHR